MTQCSIDGCGRKVQARGWCNTHYWLWNTYGSPLAETPSKRKERLVREAVAAGSKTYFTGEPCKNGHIAPRAIGGCCRACRPIHNKAKYLREPEKAKAANAKWLARNRERMRVLNREWAKRNRAKLNYKRSLRRAAEIQATPAWANTGAIAEMYRRGHIQGMDVDHIVPLRGKTVCGLHVEYNLQLLPPAENRRKHNKLLAA